MCQDFTAKAVAGNRRKSVKKSVFVAKHFGKQSTIGQINLSIQTTLLGIDTNIETTRQNE